MYKQTQITLSFIRKVVVQHILETTEKNERRWIIWFTKKTKFLHTIFTTDFSFIGDAVQVMVFHALSELESTSCEKGH